MGHAGRLVAGVLVPPVLGEQIIADWYAAIPPAVVGLSLGAVISVHGSINHYLGFLEVLVSAHTLSYQFRIHHELLRVDPESI